MGSPWKTSLNCGFGSVLSWDVAGESAIDGVGGGVDYPIAKNLSFRLAGPGIGTFLDSSGGIFCSSSKGCAMFADSNLLLQFEIISGLTFRF